MPATQSPAERELAALIISAVNLEGVDAADVDPEAPLFGAGLGLDSIDALELALEISKRCGSQLRSDDEGEPSHLRVTAFAVGLHPEKPNDLTGRPGGLMSRSRLAALLFVPLAFMLMGAKSVLVDPEPIAVPAGIAAKDVAKAIKVGIIRRGWVVSKDENNPDRRDPERPHAHGARRDSLQRRRK